MKLGPLALVRTRATTAGLRSERPRRLMSSQSAAALLALGGWLGRAPNSSPQEQALLSEVLEGDWPVVSTRALSIKALTELADDQPSSGPVDGDVRVDSGQLAGRVEVYQAKDGTWATICGTHAAT